MANLSNLQVINLLCIIILFLLILGKMNLIDKSQKSHQVIMRHVRSSHESLTFESK